jgi:3-hydroxyisobutyrate dehydrogenase-like beta-hydroxyacid dehydrogenase
VTERCGVIGVGALGRGFATRLRHSGRQVAVHDPWPGTQAWAGDAGVAWAATPRELAAASDIVLVAVPDTSEVLAALDGAAGLEAGLQDGSLLVVLSTVDPETPRLLAERLGPLGVAVVDAAVSGGPEAAADGTLAIMAGAVDADFARAKPVLDVLGSTVVHIGPVGHGELAKLVNNLMGAVIAVAISEGLAVAAKAGLDVERTCRAVAAGSGGSWILEHWIPSTALRGDYRRRFGVDLMCKDLGLIASLAAGLGVETPALDLARSRFEQLRRDGHGESDFSVVVAEAAERAGSAAFRNRDGAR